MLNHPKMWRLVRNIAGLAFVAWLGWKLYDKEAWWTWGHVNASWLICALASTALMLCLRVTKWHMLLAEDRISRGRSESARALFGAYALASVTPGRLGDFGRCMFVNESRRGRALLFTLVDKSFDLWAVASLAIASLFLFLSFRIAVSMAVAWLGLIPLGIVASRWIQHKDFLPRRLRRFHQIANAVRKVSARRFASLAVCVCIMDMLTLFFLLHAFHNVNFKVAFATYPWLVIAGSLPFSLGGVGPREGLSALLLPLFSIPAAVAVNVSLIFFALTALIPAILGAAWMVMHPPNLGRRWWQNLRNPFGHHAEAYSENPEIA